MLLSMYLDVDHRAEEEERILRIAVEQALECGRLGFHPWTTEHHFRGPWQSSPMQFMSYVAALLPETAYVGFGVLSVPYYHPVRLVEEMNLLDQLTRGRALFGLGSGFAGIEPEGMGLDAEHHGSGRAAREAIEIAERIRAFRNGDEPVRFDNGRYRGTVHRQVSPRPYRRDEPTIIRTARTDEATIAAAEKGWPIFLGAFGADLEQQWRLYRRTLAAAGHPQEVVERCLRWCTVDWLTVLVAERDAVAEDRMREAKAEVLQVRERFWELTRTGVLGPVSGADPTSREAFRTGGDMADAIVGDPDRVADRVQRLADLGINHLLLRFAGHWPGRTRPVIERSMELFAREVAPRFAERAPLTDPLALDA